MLILLVMLALVRWRVSLDDRRESAMGREDVLAYDANGREIALPGGGSMRVPDPVKRAFLAEEAMYARWSRRARALLVGVAVVWSLVLASYAGASSALNGAREMLARCDGKPAEVQACSAPAVDAYLDASGRAGEYEALAWIIGVI
jgi:hypothetical protein